MISFVRSTPFELQCSTSWIKSLRIRCLPLVHPLVEKRILHIYLVRIEHYVLLKGAPAFLAVTKDAIVRTRENALLQCICVRTSLIVVEHMATRNTTKQYTAQTIFVLLCVFVGLRDRFCEIRAPTIERTCIGSCEVKVKI